jgi:hypothetical protein
LRTTSSRNSQGERSSYVRLCEGCPGLPR